MNDILLSIIIPVYNGENDIKNCIDSIVNKCSEDNFEIIIVNDGSSDSTKNICQKICLRDKRIKLINQKNNGVSIARNKGISCAKGKYITFIDADDYVVNDYVKKIINMIDYSNNNLIVFNYYKKNDEMVVVNNIKGDYNDFESKILFLKNNKLFNSPCNKIYTKKIIVDNKLKFIKGIKSGEDFIFNISYLNYIDDIHYVNTPLYIYYNNNNSITHKKAGVNLLQQQHMFNTEYLFFKKNGYNLSVVLFDYLEALYTIVKFNIVNNIDKELSLNEMKVYYDNTYIKNIRDFKKLNCFYKYLYKKMIQKDFNKAYIAIKLRGLFRERVKYILLKLKILKFKWK